MPPPSPDSVVRRWPTHRSRQWLKSFLERARPDSNVLAVVVVGSAVRTDVPCDDLDIIVLCHDRKLLNERAPIEVDLRSFDMEEVEHRLEEGQDLLTWSVRFGRSIFDRDEAWEAIVARWRDHLPLPDPAVARARAATAGAQLREMSIAGDQDAVVDLNVSYLTHLARAFLAEAGVYPASRPELPDQLREVGESDLADELTEALLVRNERRTADTAV